MDWWAEEGDCGLKAGQRSGDENERYLIGRDTVDSVEPSCSTELRTASESEKSLWHARAASSARFRPRSAL
jgi:hypothetical protein